MNQIAVVNQGGKASAERVIVLPREEFDALIGRPGEKEFRIYCEDLEEEFPIRVMTKGFCAALSEAYDCNERSP